MISWVILWYKYIPVHSENMPKKYLILQTYFSKKVFILKEKLPPNSKILNFLYSPLFFEYVNLSFLCPSWDANLLPSVCPFPAPPFSTRPYSNIAFLIICNSTLANQKLKLIKLLHPRNWLSNIAKHLSKNFLLYQPCCTKSDLYKGTFWGKFLCCTFGTIMKYL